MFQGDFRVRLNPTLAAILLAGLVAGTVDIGAASLINRAPPSLILQAIASGILGKASFASGSNSAVLGLFLQWAISIFIAAIYIGAARTVPLLARRWILGGLAYGVAIYFTMNFVVVPLSNAPFGHQAFNPAKAGLDLLALLVFGVIVARFAHAPRA